LTPLDRELLRLALPALATLVAEPLYVLTDTAIVGHLGTDQLGGMALATSIVLTGYSICLFLAYGTTAAVARLLGAGREQQAADQAAQGMWLALLLGAALAVGLGLGASPLVAALGGRGAVGEFARLYLRISVAGFPALLTTLAGVGYLRGLQDTRTPLFVAVGTAVLNLVLEVVLIYGLGFGLGASALATVVAQWLGAGVFLWRVFRAVAGHGVGLRPRWQALRSLLAVGAHLVLRTAALRGSLILGTAAAARLGRDDLAAYHVGFEVWSFLALALDAVAIAAQAMVGRALGAGDTATARAIGRRVNYWGIWTGVVLGAVVLMTRYPLARVFTDDPAVVHLAAWSLLWVGATQPLNGWVFALDGTLIGAGDQRYLAGAMAVAFAAFAPVIWWAAAARPGLGWLWAALSWLMAARLLALQGRFMGGRWAVAGSRR
jgi:putative MATE family efflux protein